MGKLDNLKRILKQDYESEYHGLIDKLAYTLNRFMEQVVTQVNGELDFDNLKEEVRDYKVTVNASGVPTTNDTIRTEVPNPGGVVVIKAKNLTDTNVYPTAAPWISFKPSGNTLKIVKITGLQAANSYNLTLRISPKA